MIGYLEGTILNALQDKAIIGTASGVGYEVFCLHPYIEGQKVQCFIATIQKENSLELFAFTTMQEKMLFELLLLVKGVGPKSAFALVKGTNVSELKMAIVEDEPSLLTKIPGVGLKTAKQIILDLKSKISKDPIFIHHQMVSTDFKSSLPLLSVKSELHSALINLGYKEPEIQRMISSLEINKEQKLEDLLKQVLQLN